MFSENMRPVYKRLTVLCLLCACLFVFGSGSVTENVSARICIEACYDRQNSCYDACPVDCSTTDQTCRDCIEACDSRFRTCVSGSTYCNTGYSYAPHCQVGWADHCPWDPSINDYNCSSADAHSGYYEICDYGPGGSQCISCPDHEICIGSNGLPPCL